MTDTFVTLHGWLGGDVQVRQAGDAQVASFRLACTPRRYSRRTETWSNGPTQWYSVNAWRVLGENCRDSLRRGDPVVVHGRLEAQVWVNNAGVEVTSFVVEATSVGHDLNRGVSRFAKTVRAEASGGGTAAPSGAQEHEADEPREESTASAA
ncbi:MAG TPA: single-stranded DNA-binding protein [Nocardioides sp.]|jgi:single-strand DNA-binding protein|uniref:single-stranded DNA-binding protein n=1 Tax=Nocardioides sp. TaxID=35761 RepID=UPI002CA4F5F6|nr:single-stranded DNA-binding protein [Nocardioides sp.]HTW17300.1 single-stranded DNA-binding protein [Nocardioides sp.]